MIRQEIIKLIEDSVKEVQGSLPDFKIDKVAIERPGQKIHGDYSTNVALKIAKDIKKNPIEIAKLIRDHLRDKKSKLFDKIEVVKPGFVNFFLSKDYLGKQLEKVIKEKERFGELKIGKGKRVQVEFISANPTGPLTVANARGGPFGDVLGNVFKKAGFEVEKAYYINDCGMQILALGHSVLKDKEARYKGEYIDYLNKIIKEKDPYRAGEKAAKIIVEEMLKGTAQKLRIKYDEWFSEKSLHESGEIDKIIEYFRKKDLAYEKEGALWFKSSNYGDERDRVLVKSDGSKTYLAGDAAYHKYKFEKKKFDKVINIWGADHYGDVPGLKAVVAALGHEGKLDIVILQFVTLLEKGKKMRMSKRKGIYVTMDELLNKIDVDVIRFFSLQKSANTHLNFDISLAKEQSEKNPVYYVQYAYARICSILEKAKKEKIELIKLEHSSEIDLAKHLIKFPEVVEDTVKDYQVHRIPQYSRELAESFHHFYANCKVLGEEKELQESRLALVLATKYVLKNTLKLMGISAPEKM